MVGRGATHSGYRWLGAASGRRPGQEVLLRLTELLVRELEEAHAVQVRAVTKEDNSQSFGGVSPRGSTAWGAG